MAAEIRNVWANISELAAVDITAAAVITDSSGGTNPGNNIIAAVTNPTLSDWDGTTVFPSAAQATAIVAAFTAIKAAIAQLAAKMNTDRTAIIGLETAVNALKDSFILKG